MSRLLVSCVTLLLGLERIIIFHSVGDIHDTYRCFHKEYRLLICNFLNSLENNKVTKLCNAAESCEKLFWKLLKGQWSSSQMSAFLVDDKLITDRNLIREMWVNHFEALGTPLNSENFDSNFFLLVLLVVLKTFLNYAVRIFPEPCVHHWSMKKLLVSAPV